MRRLRETVVSDIVSVYTVYAEKGRHIDITHRASYRLSFCHSGRITYTHHGKQNHWIASRKISAPSSSIHWATAAS